jgi:AraC-like DNA-binding protein
MVTACGTLRIGGAKYSSRIGVERTFRVYSVERYGTLYDTRFVRGTEDVRIGSTVVYLLLDGWIRLHNGGELRAPLAFRALAQVVDGVGEAKLTLTNGGEPFRAVQVAIVDDPAPPTTIEPLPIPEEVVTAARAVGASRPHELADAIAALLSKMSAAGLLEPDFASRITAEESLSTKRLWNVISDCFMTIRTAPTMQELCTATQLSMRQCAREVDKFSSTFGIQWRGLRAAVSDLRRRWAILLLSDRSLPITEVAKATGYGSVDALGRAFRDLALPSPSAIREAMLAQASSAS